jgi:threonine synthase
MPAPKEPPTRKFIKCSRCGTEYPSETTQARCIACGGVLLFRYDYMRIAEDMTRESLGQRIPSVWKYSELLPIKETSSIVSLGEGGTYLHKCSRLNEYIKVRRLLLKDETTNPTASFIDRGCTVSISRAIESGATSICCGTTGNLGASMSAYAAKAGLGAVVFLPKTIDLGKLYQMIVFGAKVELTTDYESAVKRAARLDRPSLLLTPHNPYFMEGEKTSGYEIIEQMGWNLPSRIIVPMGSGGHLAMIWKAVNEFIDLGLIARPEVKMTGVQAAGTSPITDAYLNAEATLDRIRSASTLAHDIGIESPSAGDLALKAVQSSKGTCLKVSDREILEAAALLAKSEGIFAEPAAASTIAGLKKLVDLGYVDRDEEVVCVITGAGLKDPITARRFVKKARSLEQAIRSVEARRLTTRLGPTKLQVLQILSDNEEYGYQVWKKLDDRFGTSVKVPVVYQHLKELENMGLIRRTGVREIGGTPERRYYTIMEKGRSALTKFGD